MRFAIGSPAAGVSLPSAAFAGPAPQTRGPSSTLRTGYSAPAWPTWPDPDPPIPSTLKAADRAYQAAIDDLGPASSDRS